MRGAAEWVTQRAMVVEQYVRQIFGCDLALPVRRDFSRKLDIPTSIGKALQYETAPAHQDRSGHRVGIVRLCETLGLPLRQRA